MKRHSLYISVLLALALAGCQKDMQVEAPSAFVRFNPTIAQSEAQTKAQSGESITEGVLATEDGTFSIPMSCEESEGIGASAMDEPATKGSLIGGTGTGSVALSAGMTFNVTAWDNAATPLRTIPTASSSATSDVVSYSNSEWTTATEYEWKKDSVMTFYAYANLPTATGAASVSCASAAGQTLTYDVTKVATASAQTDILLGFYKGDSKSGSPAEMTGTANIVFSHPLAAVQFKLGTVKGVTTFAVNSVSIENVHASGTASMTASSSGEISWTPADSTTVSQTVTTQPTTSKPQIGEAFLLIPQTFATSSTARIAFNVTIDGAKKVNLYYPLASTQWKTGYCYTYTIGFDGRTYSYTFSSNNLTPLSFTNTTTASSPTTVEISSKSVQAGDDASDADWLIQSVKVGSAGAVPVGAASFTNIGGISAEKDGNKLKVTALARTPQDRGSNDYWTNKDGISGDKAGTGWSPKDWSTTKATSTAPLDLSKFDFQTEETTTTMTTSNCYIIRHAGTYKIPLAYGNAIKGGAANTEAYSPTVASGGTSYLKPFQNHLGYGIISPFIEYNTSNGNAKSSSNSYLAPASASIVWQDKSSIITSVSLSTSKETVRVGSTDYSISYLVFTIPQDKICQNNAVIAVKDGSGNIMWSWHIWTTNDPALLDSPVQVTNLTSVHYDFFPIGPLGLIEGRRYPALNTVVITLEQKYSGKTIDITVVQPEVPGEQSVSVFYQWGRKDPMRSFSVDNASGPVNLQTAMQNPQNFYTNNGDWCSSTYLNLWTGKASLAGAADQGDNLIKTVYDPSPAGYKVPAGKAFTGFTTKTDGSGASNISDFNADTDKGFINGWYFYTEPGRSGGTVFFPATQWRTATDGAVINAVKTGGYWTANAGTSSNGLKMSFAAASITTVINASRSYANAVRPVKE